MSARRTQFAWPDGNPTKEAEFDRLVWALDKHLAEQRGQPLHRLMGFYIEDALQEAGLDCGISYARRGEAVNEPGYTGEPLVAKVFQWYKQVYGEKVLGRNAIADMWSVGFFPARLGHEAVWKVRVPIITTWPRFVCDAEDFKGSGGDNYVGHDAKTVNVLRLVENLPSKLIDYMSEVERADLTALCATALCATGWLRAADKTLAVAKTVAEKNRALFWHARQDYVSSTANLLSYNYSQSRWSSAQAVEKILKGLFKVVVGEDAQKTHDLMVLAKQLEPSLTQSIDAALLSAATWPTSARYDETKTTLEECLCANHAVLRLAEQFSKDDKVVELFDGARAK